MKYALQVVLVLLTASILSFLALGLHMRMLADDYCLTHDIRTFGVLGNVVKQYTYWAGGYTDPLLKGLLYASVGLSAHSSVAFLVYGLWWAGLFVLVYALLHSLGWSQATPWSALLSSACVLTFLSAIPSRSIVYWLNGTLPYVLPLSLLPWTLAFWWWAGKKPNQAMWKHGLIVLMSIILAGMHIVWPAVILSIWLSLAACLWLLEQRRTMRFRLCLSAALTTLAAIVVVLIAPGNWRRLQLTQTLIVERPSIAEALMMSLEATLRTWASPFVLGHMALLAFLVASLYYMAAREPSTLPWAEQVSRYALWLIAAGLLWALLLSWGVLSLPALGYGRLATRVYAPVRALQLGFGLWVGLLLGMRMADSNFWIRLRPALISAALAACSLLAMHRLADNIRLWPDYAAWAAQWDARHEALLEAARQGAQRVLVAPFSATLPRLLGPVTDDVLVDWVRYCMHDFYGIADIQADASVSAEEVLRVVEPSSP